MKDFWAGEDSGIVFVAPDVFSTKDFLETESFRRTAEGNVREVFYLLSEFGGEGLQDPVLGAGFEREVRDRAKEIYEGIRNEVMYHKQSGTEIKEIWVEDSRFSISYDFYGEYGSDNYSVFVLDGFELLSLLDNPILMKDGEMRHFEEPGVMEEFERIFRGQIKTIRENVRFERTLRFNRSLEGIGGLLYFVSDGENVLTNMDLKADGYPRDYEIKTSYPAWLVIEEGSVTSGPKGLFDPDGYLLKESMRVSAIIAWPQETLAEYRAVFNEAVALNRAYFFTAAALALGALVFLVVSFAFTGRKRPSYGGTRKLWKCDRIFVEIQIVVLFFLFAAGGLLASMVTSSSERYNPSAYFETYVFLASGALLALGLSVLWFLMSVVRIGKAGLTADRSLVCRFVSGPGVALADAIKSGFDGRNPLAKTIILVIVFWVLTALFSGMCGVALGFGRGGAVLAFGILILLTLAGALYFTSKWVARYERLRKGVDEIGGGNLGYKIEIPSDGKNEFDRLSARVNELGSAQNAAVQNELKNQRLKTDLISNVSHDLKTPLTSIITYTDLLKTEGLKSKNAEEYLKVIDEKGRRLQKLTEDLFDAAKASSGAIPVRKEKVDLLALIRQEIAEMNGSFDEAGLELIIEAESENYFVEADSQLLWRVVDNLLRNARKYAQSGTRVYIDLKEHVAAYQGDGTFDRTITAVPTTGGIAAASRGNALLTTLEIKNTSAVKLNIPPEELMERFKRGDESRASEGSGLGLAIAKDLVRLQGGWFELSIDGDLFKAVVMLPPWGEE